MKQFQLAEVWINTFHRSLWGREASEGRIEFSHQIKTLGFKCRMFISTSKQSQHLRRHGKRLPSMVITPIFLI